MNFGRFRIQSKLLRISIQRRYFIDHVNGVKNVPPPGAFSQAVVHNGVVYVSGTGADKSHIGGSVTFDMNLTEETRSALANVIL